MLPQFGLTTSRNIVARQLVVIVDVDTHAHTLT